MKRTRYYSIDEIAEVHVWTIDFPYGGEFNQNPAFTWNIHYDVFLFDGTLYTYFGDTKKPPQKVLQFIEWAAYAAGQQMYFSGAAPHVNTFYVYANSQFKFPVSKCPHEVPTRFRPASYTYQVPW